MVEPYNPLAKRNLAISIERTLLEQAPEPLTKVGSIIGAGVYVLYYSGPFAAYAPIRASLPSASDAKAADLVPIYVGKAIPEGSRKGGLGADAATGTALRGRLRQHAASIKACENLDVEDFWQRHLVLDDIWIPLGENMLIETFKPVWNRELDGFGNNAPGTRRETQYRSAWDTLHPGRRAAAKLPPNPRTPEYFVTQIARYFSALGQ